MHFGHRFGRKATFKECIGLHPVGIGLHPVGMHTGFSTNAILSMSLFNIQSIDGLFFPHPVDKVIFLLIIQPMITFFTFSK